MGLSRAVALAVGLVVTLAGCGQLTAPTPSLVDSSTYFTSPGAAFFTTVPQEIPRTLVLGRPVRVTVVPDAPPDHHVEFVGEGHYVRWIIPDPPCPQNTCADLLGVVVTPPGIETAVVIWICPPGFSSFCPSGPSHSLTVVAE